MGKLAKSKLFDEGFWADVNLFHQDKTPEYCKNEFSKMVESFNAGECNIHLLMMMALMLGKKEGLVWFREMVPAEIRRAECEEIDNNKLPKTTKRNLKEALLGDSAH